MNNLKTFACQIAMGKVYSIGSDLEFSTIKGITCLDAGSPNDMFDRLMTYYNSKELVQELIAAGDVLKLSHSTKSNLYALDDYGNRIIEHTCVTDSHQYKQLLGQVPCVFVYCVISQRWFFFSFKLNGVAGEGDIIPYLVSELVSIRDVTKTQPSASLKQRLGLSFAF